MANAYTANATPFQRRDVFQHQREVALYSHIGTLRMWLHQIERTTKDPESRRMAQVALEVALKP